MLKLPEEELLLEEDMLLELDEDELLLDDELDEELLLDELELEAFDSLYCLTKCSVVMTPA